MTSWGVLNAPELYTLRRLLAHCAVCDFYVKKRSEPRGTILLATASPIAVFRLS